MKTRTAFTKSMIVAAALTTALAFTGCSTNPSAQSTDDGGNAAVDSSIEALAEEAAEDGVDIQAVGDLPKDFPAEVPLVDGTVRGATGTAGLQWTVFLNVDNAETAINLAREKLTGAGFTEVMWEDPYMEKTIMGLFSTDAYHVSVSTRPANDPQVVQYLVKATG